MIGGFSMSKGIKIMILLFSFLLVLYFTAEPIAESVGTLERFNPPLAGKVIVLDPGHGGVDGGAVGADQTSEKEITLILSRKLRAYLQQAGAEVYLTRETDDDLADESTRKISERKVEDIKRRVAFIEEKDPDLFLTIHLNALPTSQWRGAQVFYHPNQPESKMLAEAIQAEIKSHLANTTREALAINNVYLLKHINRPAALVEAGFLSNPEERELLKQAPYQEKVAASIYYGILRFYNEK